MKGNIKQQFSNIIFIIIIILLLIQSLIFALIVKQNNTKIREYILGISNSAYNTISNIDRNLMRAGLSVSYNPHFVNLFTKKAKQHNVDDSIQNVHNYTRLIQDYNPGLLDVTIVDLNGIPRSFLAGVDYNIITELSKCYDFNDSSSLQRKYFFFPPESSFSDKYFVYLIPVQDLPLPKSINKKVATAVFINRLSVLADAINIGGGGFVLNITTESGQKLCENRDSTKISSKVAELKLTNMGISLNAYTSPSQLYNSSKSILLLVIVLFFMIILSLAFVARFVDKVITIPITLLSRDLEAIGTSGTTSKRVPVSNIKDINIIAVNINKMLGRLDETTRKVFQTQDQLYEMELRSKEAELYALRSQVNPHFLFNTLQCIKGIANYNKDMDVVSVITYLSELLRYSIKIDEHTTISEELNILQTYLKIAKYRFPNRFNYHFSIDDDALDMRCLRMILQPIAENIIDHGFKKLDSEGEIIITVKVIEDTVSMSLSDNGCGVDENLLKDIQSSLKNGFQLNNSSKKDSIGLFNINRRIKLFFGPEYGLTIENQDIGCIVTVTIPAINDNNLNFPLEKLDHT